MNVLIVATYYNAPHFIELQSTAFKWFVKDNYEFLIIDDSDDSTKSILTGKFAKEEIINECKKHGISMMTVPQSVHDNVSNGGLVPDGLPAGHPTERHRACLHWILKSVWKVDYDMVVMLESDMLPRRPISFVDILGDRDIVGTGRVNCTLRKTLDPNQYWPDEIRNMSEITLDFFTMYMTIVNLHTVNNLNEMDIGGFAGTDTGGKTGLFLINNPLYKYKFIHIFNNIDDQVDSFAVDNPTEESAEFVHYRGGSNWDHQTKDYYREKLNRMLNKYVPELGNRPVSTKDLTSKDKEHTFKGK